MGEGAAILVSFDEWLNEAENAQEGKTMTLLSSSTPTLILPLLANNLIVNKNYYPNFVRIVTI